MAKAIAALLSGALLRTAALAGEVDPARRSLVVQAVERASPAVVNISTEEVVERRGSPFPFPQDPFFDEFFRDFFDARPQRFTRTSLGSGVIVDGNGTLLTNQHVVLRATRIHATLADGREFDAKLVGADADTDLAVLRIAAGERLPAVTLGTSADLMIGETLIAIGNPFGFSHTVTTGVVSAVGRSLRDEERTYTDLIQTDASINPGNSGGPLLNIKGELVGINTAIYSRSGGNIGIGFAIPIDRTRRVLRDLVAYGEVQRGWLGLTVQELSEPLAQHFGTRKGVLVAEVEPRSPAAAAGLARGDLITRVGGHEVQSRDEFEDRIAAHGAGERVTVTVRREGGSEDVEMAVAAFPDADADQLLWRLLGLDVKEARGALVVERVRQGSPAARIGVERGDRLLGLAGVGLESERALRRKVVELRGARSVLLSIGRGPYQYNVNVPVARGG
jgi:serine protease Do